MKEIYLKKCLVCEGNDFYFYGSVPKCKECDLDFTRDFNDSELLRLMKSEYQKASIYRQLESMFMK